MSNHEPKTFTVQLSSSAIAVIEALFIEGPLFDGDIPSKNGRDELVRLGLAFRSNGYQSLTSDGLSMVLKTPLAAEKDRHIRRRQKAFRLMRLVDDIYEGQNQAMTNKPTIAELTKNQDND